MQWGAAMDLRKVKKLIELVEESGIAELEVKSGDEAIRIVRPNGASMPGAPALGEASAATAPPTTAATAQVKPRPARTTLTAPMAGTVYAAPSPGAAPFVHLGTEVALGEILCIIESMKMMNEIPAQAAGKVVEILLRDGEPVADGQPLFRIEPTAAA